ncbi:MAG TPA: protein kinase family protein [Acidimicrobiia bacterium]|nr:protein kinase family protein [Acidimicrobiia bacterium]
MLMQLRAGQVVVGYSGTVHYRIVRRLGEGGFGVAYEAEELDREGHLPRAVCIKVTDDQDRWQSEAYFGRLLRSNRRVIEFFDSFAFRLSRWPERLLNYALVLEYAPHGSMDIYLRETGRWPESRAKNEVVGLLKALDDLHRCGIFHRDLTPMNVLVAKGGRLKLADFGIAQQGLGGKPVPADFWNYAWVTRGMKNFERRNWSGPDDVFQMGQVLGVLLYGRGDTRIGARHVKSLNCTDATKDVIRRSIGPRPLRYIDALEMLTALQAPPVAPAGVLRRRVPA